MKLHIVTIALLIVCLPMWGQQMNRDERHANQNEHEPQPSDCSRLITRIGGGAMDIIDYILRKIDQLNQDIVFQTFAVVMVTHRELDKAL